MAVVSIASLKAKWILGYKPTHNDYVDVFDTLSDLPIILSLQNGVLKSPDLVSFFIRLLDTGVIITNAGSDTKININTDRIILTATNLVSLVSSNVISFDSSTIVWPNQAGGGKRNLYINNSGIITPGIQTPFIYKAMLSQIGTNTPTVTRIFENTIGDIVWTYTGVGSYVGTLIGAFMGPTNVPITSGFCLPGNNLGSYSLLANDADTVQLYTIDYLTNSLQDEFLNNTLITIEVYP